MGKRMNGSYRGLPKSQPADVKRQRPLYSIIDAPERADRASATGETIISSPLTVTNEEHRASGPTSVSAF